MVDIDWHLDESEILRALAERISKLWKLSLQIKNWGAIKCKVDLNLQIAKNLESRSVRRLNISFSDCRDTNLCLSRDVRHLEPRKHMPIGNN